MRHPKNLLDIPNRTLTKHIFKQQKSANAILKNSAILIFFPGISWVCALQTGFYRLKKKFSLQWQDPLKEK
jgi:cell division protein YceG involved in septum cleavage